MLGIGSELQLPVRHAVTRVSNRFSKVLLCIFTSHYAYKMPISPASAKNWKAITLDMKLKITAQL